MNQQSQKAPQSFRGRLFQQEAGRPKEQRILVLKTGLAGRHFHVENEEERAVLQAIAPGTELLLVREPENRHDVWAVAVYLTKEDKLGYLTRFKNETIARLMDVGKRFVAVTDDPKALMEEEANLEQRELYRRHWAPTEDMDFPLSVYLIEEG